MALVVIVIVSVVVGLTMLVVTVSERINRKSLVAQAVKNETQTLESELGKAQASLESVKRLSLQQEREILGLKSRLNLLGLDSRLEMDRNK